MDKQTIEQQEGVAALDRRHHDTTNATRRRCCQISWQNWAIIGLLVFSAIGGGSFGGLYVYKTGPGFLGLVPAEYGLKSYSELLAEVDQLRGQLVEATAKAQNEAWLWNSQILLIATLEDDPSKLTGEPWDFFLDHATLNRLEGFLLIINDGNHPRLAEWHGLQTTKINIGGGAINDKF